MTEKGLIPLKETGSFVYGTNEPVYAFVTWDDIADVWDRAYNDAPECPTDDFDGISDTQPPSDTELAESLLGAVNGMLAHSLIKKDKYVDSKYMNNSLDRTEQAINEFDRDNSARNGIDFESINMVRQMSGSYDFFNC